MKEGYIATKKKGHSKQSSLSLLLIVA